jgi:hypothetical protein
MAVNDGDSGMGIEGHRPICWRPSACLGDVLLQGETVDLQTLVILGEE